MFVFVLFYFFILSNSGDVGILYAVWHTHAALAMKAVAKKGGKQLTVETIIQSNGELTLDDVYKKYGVKEEWIYNVEPAELGFYCLYKKRVNDTHPPVEDCDNVEETAKRHAELLLDGGIDYVAMDHTNWPVVSTETDIAVLRPTEVLFEEWKKLRDKGTPTPKIAIWPCSPPGSNTWKWFLDNLYNKPEFEELVYKKDGKKVVFIPSDDNKAHYCMPNEEITEKILSNGGRNDTMIINMWCQFDQEFYKTKHWWAFMSPCVNHEHGWKGYTSSVVGAGECNQPETLDEEGKLEAITASASYQLFPTAIPFGSPGKLRGLTLQVLFKKILEKKPPNVFISSFNEHIGGRANHPFGVNNGFDMGLPNDTQKWKIWFDTYGYEFSRDVEPSVEGGNHIWNVLSDCIHLYKKGKTCEDEPKNLCCTKEDKYIWNNVWSLQPPSGDDRLLTTHENEKNDLVSKGWKEICNPFIGPTVFCVDGTIQDGRPGPFMLYSVEQHESIALYRCFNEAKGIHFFSIDEKCEGKKMESRLGFISNNRGGETLRELRRCKFGESDEAYYIHSLDLPCDKKDTGVLGFVR